MSKNIISSIIQFIILAVVQIFILDNINLFGYINPMLYIWFIIMLPYNTPKWLVLISSFLMGISIDVFSADIGVNATCSVLIGFLRPILLSIFSGNIDKDSSIRPSISTLGFLNFLLYSLIIVFIHHSLYFIIETFSFKEFLQVLLRISLSTIVTMLFILLLDTIFYHKKG
ncbi:MAG: rod shape-determining protein MreD [Bacteroidales bacterium]|jgi:rod shape-determining protein MreD|nr:rod shape-determining protein MreD [Bacteroidales bacterium]